LSLRERVGESVALPHPRRQGAAVPALSLGLVDGAVRHLVRLGVFLARDVRRAPGAERLEQRLGLVVEGLEAVGLDRVLAVELVDHQLAVGANFNLARAEFLGGAKAKNEALVLGDVVRGLAQRLLLRGDGLSGGILDHRAGACRARVAARRAVRKDEYLSMVD